MNGLEQILSTIEQEANQEAEQILSAARADAQKRAESICAEAKNEADAYLAQAAKKVKQIQENTDALCESIIRRGELAAKSKLIQDCIDAVKQKWTQAEPEEYFSMLEQLAVRYAHPTSGEMLLSESDYARMPKDFAENLNRALPEGAALTVVKTEAKINGGMILRYGAIEENCGFDALLEEKNEQIKDKLFAALGD